MPGYRAVAPGGGRFHAGECYGGAGGKGLADADLGRRDCDRRIGPVDGPAPLMADLASFSRVSEPIHRHR